MYKEQTVVIIIPLKPNFNVAISHNLFQWLSVAMSEWTRDSRMEGYSLRLMVDTCGVGDQNIKCHLDRAAHVSNIRDYCIHKSGVLQDETIVAIIWIDADIVRAPKTLLTELFWMAGVIPNSQHNMAVTAPSVMLESLRTDGAIMPTNRWYDTLGFQTKGNPARVTPPYLIDVPYPPPNVVRLDGSVGTLYCVPATVYREMYAIAMRDDVPARFHFAESLNETEHYSVCQFAVQMDIHLLWLTYLKVEHACLPYYGENFH